MLSFRAIVMAAIGVCGSVAAIVLPYHGLLLLGVLYFFRPDLWGAEMYVRPVLWLTVAIALGWLVNRKTTGTLEGAWWVIALVLLYVISTLFAPLTSEDSWEGLIHILKIFVAVFLIVKLCDTPARLATFVLAVLVGVAWFIKVAVMAGAAVGFSGSVRIDTGVGQGGGANYIAWVLASTLPFVMYKAAYGKVRERYIAMAFFLPWLAGIVATGSRGGLLCLVAAVGTFLALVRRFRALLVGGVIAIAFFALAPAEYTQRVATVTLDPAKMDASALSRYQNIQAGIGIIRDYPLFGTGLRTFPTVKLRYVGRDYAGQAEHVAHNTFIQMGSEVGLPLLAVFLSLNVWLVWRLRSRSTPGPDEEDASRLEWIRVGVVSAIAATIVQMMKGDVAHMDYLWWLYAIAFVCRRLREKARAPAPAQVSRRTRPARAGRLAGAPQEA